eukprot:7705332-Ditylum_brightwellii.AAC.1
MPVQLMITAVQHRICLHGDLRPWLGEVRRWQSQLCAASFCLDIRLYWKKWLNFGDDPIPKSKMSKGQFE